MTGVPTTRRDDPQRVAECVTQLTNTRLGLWKPTFLVCRAATSTLRFSILFEDHLPETIELNGKLLQIVKYDSNQKPPQAPASKIANVNLAHPHKPVELPPQPISEPTVPITACFMCRKLGDFTAECSRRTRGQEMKRQD